MSLRSACMSAHRDFLVAWIDGTRLQTVDARVGELLCDADGDVGRAIVMCPPSPWGESVVARLRAIAEEEAEAGAAE